MTFAVAPVPMVLDASFAIELIQGRQAARDAVAGWVQEDRLQLVPPHFWAEVANALVVGMHMPAAEAMVRLERLAAAGAEVADRGITGLLDAVRLAGALRLSVYDALYLSLALDVEGELATLDRRLARAARSVGVQVVDAS